MTRGAKVAFDGVGAGDFDEFVVEQPRAFAGVGESEAPRGACGPSHQSAAEQSLEIDDEVEAFALKLREEGDEVSHASQRAVARRNGISSSMIGQFFRSEASVSLMIQEMCASGNCRRMRLTVGSAWTTSPTELGLMIRIRTWSAYR